MSASDKADARVEGSEDPVAPSPEAIAQAVEQVATDDVSMSDSSDRGRDPKNRFAVVFGYVGTRFQGLQRNPGALSVEDELEKILLKVGLMDEKNAGNFAAVGWNRAARTDKGVHAAWQVISLRMRIGKGEEDDWVKKCNEVAPDDLKVFAIVRVTKLFNSKNYCSGRRYGYLLPTFLLEPRPRALYVSRDPVVPAALKSVWLKRSGIPTEDEPIPGLSTESIVNDPYCNGSAFTKARDELRQLRIAQAEAQRQAMDEDTKEAVSSTSHYVSTVVENSVYAQSLVQTESLPTSEADAYQTGEAFVKGRQEVRDALVTAADDYRTHGFRLSEDRWQLLQRTLKRYKGTHAYHNFTPRFIAGDATTVRYVTDCHVSKPMLLPDEFSKSISFHPPKDESKTEGTRNTRKGETDVTMGGAEAISTDESSLDVPIMEYVHITIIGQSFLLNQIRHMVGLAVDIARGAAPEFAMDFAFSSGNINVPLAPAEGLYLDACFFEAYDRRYNKATGHPSMTRLPAYNLALMDEFRKTVIWPHMVRSVWHTKPFHNFIRGLNTAPITYRLRVDDRILELLAGVNATRATGRKRERGENTEDSEADSSEQSEKATIDRGIIPMELILQPAAKTLVTDGAALSRVAREKSEYKKKVKEEKAKLRDAALAKWEEKWNKKHGIKGDGDGSVKSGMDGEKPTKNAFPGWKGRGRHKKRRTTQARVQTWKPTRK